MTQEEIKNSFTIKGIASNLLSLNTPTLNNLKDLLQKASLLDMFKKLV